ncbi:hypothetical protein HERIO_2373 [Hepatospora eriocheir]|uniref:Uncharacterized protein n=1 Tax=Hepatospora eriocheir TaxID=1081669 RepID=A0A1X0Q745_9MICR|nr:hypothetical protein HERIO_2373 [Hepatospora eriocheir]
MKSLLFFILTNDILGYSRGKKMLMNKVGKDLYKIKEEQALKDMVSNSQNPFETTGDLYSDKDVISEMEKLKGVVAVLKDDISEIKKQLKNCCGVNMRNPIDAIMSQTGPINPQQCEELKSKINDLDSDSDSSDSSDSDYFSTNGANPYQFQNQMMSPQFSYDRISPMGMMPSQQNNMMPPQQNNMMSPQQSYMMPPQQQMNNNFNNMNQQSNVNC